MKWETACARAMSAEASMKAVVATRAKAFSLMASSFSLRLARFRARALWREERPAPDELSWRRPDVVKQLSNPAEAAVRFVLFCSSAAGERPVDHHAFGGGLPAAAAQPPHP